MIRAFGALAQAGSPDALHLQTVFRKPLSIPHLVSPVFARILMYNFYSTQIDSFTFKIDEAGFSLVHHLQPSPNNFRDCQLAMYDYSVYHQFKPDYHA